MLSDRHAKCARQLPDYVNDLWAFVAALDVDSRMAVLAPCVTSMMTAVSVARTTSPCARANADAIAHAVGLDMTAFWAPTVRTYFGLVSKARILEADTEAVSADAANRLAGMKKQAMAEAAEQCAATRWSPPLLRKLAIVRR